MHTDNCNSAYHESVADRGRLALPGNETLHAYVANAVLHAPKPSVDARKDVTKITLCKSSKSTCALLYRKTSRSLAAVCETLVMESERHAALAYTLIDQTIPQLVYTLIDQTIPHALPSHWKPESEHEQPAVLSNEYVNGSFWAVSSTAVRNAHRHQRRVCQLKESETVHRLSFEQNE
eukprot:3027630-Pleurochrysis_carterae.AAC.3